MAISPTKSRAGRKPDPNLRHGTFYAYKKKGCRCADCRDRINSGARTYRARGRKGKSLNHGTRTSYNNGCRCDSCTRANADYAKLWKRVKSAA